MKNNLLTLLVFLFAGIHFLRGQETTEKNTPNAEVFSVTRRTIKTEVTANELSNSKNSPTEQLDYLQPASNTAAKTSSEAGSTAGSLSVSLTGAANYAIPIMVPPGIKDVVPSIGITYSSQGSDGLVGWGWNLTGLSTISRLSTTKYHDNKHGNIDFNDDRFSLDGQRLILKSGTYGANGSVYQTESYSNIKVIAYGSSPYGRSYGPSYFVVYYPNGSRAWYGNGGNSRSRLEWAIFRWQDSQGNYIDYNYQSDNGLLSIKNIKYGGKINRTSPMNLIEFTYTNRDRSENIYIGEELFKRTHLLESIKVSTNAKQYRKYVLIHDKTSLGYNRLKTVTEYNALEKYLNPISFSYEDTSSYIKSRVKTPIKPYFDTRDNGVIVGDYNGDGKTDIAYYDKEKKDEIHVHGDLNNKNSFAYTIKTSFDDIFSSVILSHNNKLLTQQGITIVNGFAHSEKSNGIIRFRTFAESSSSLIYQYDKFWEVPTYNYQLGCENSNHYKDNHLNIKDPIGYNDIFQPLANTITATNNIKTGGYGVYKASKNIILKPGFTVEKGANFEAKMGAYPRDVDKVTVPMRYISGDFNGDGLTDVIALEEQYTESNCYWTHCDDVNPEKPEENPEHGDTSDQDTPNSEDYDKLNCCECRSWEKNTNTTLTHFINLKRTLTENFANKAGYLEAGIGSKDKILVADHNGDGKQDLYHFKEGKLYIYTLNDSNKLILLHIETDINIRLNNSPFLLGDYNGDGKTDFVTPTAEKTKVWKFFISKGKAYYKANKSLDFTWIKDYRKNHGYKHYTDYEYRYTAQDINADGKTDLIFHNMSFTRRTVLESDVLVSNKENIKLFANTHNSSGLLPNFHAKRGYEGSESTNSEEDTVVGKYGFPISLEANRTNGNLEYGYISYGKIYMHTFAKDHKQDVLLRGVNNNGVTSKIDYGKMVPAEHLQDDSPYSWASSQEYPFINIKTTPSFSLVKKLTETGAGKTRYQDFKYHGATSNIYLGFQGFLETKRTNWYGDDVGTLWTITKHDPKKRGAILAQFVGYNAYDTRNYLSKTTNTYSTSLASNKVFTRLPIKTYINDKLSGVTTTKTISYDAFNNPLIEHTTFNGGSQKISYNYYNNSTVTNENYHIGRIKDKTQINTLGGNSFTTQEVYNYTNNLLQQQKVKGNNTNWNIEEFTYDVFGNVTEKKLTPSGLTARTESHTYSADGRFLMTSMDIEGLKTSFTAYDDFGNLKSITNPFGHTSTYSYDGWNRLISEKDYLNKTTTFSYENIAGGGLKKSTDYPQGADEIEEYNAFGWVVKSGALGVNNKWIYKSFEYDVTGKLHKESEPYFSSPTQWNTTYYDAEGRVDNKTSFNGLVASITYNGLTTSVDDGTKTVITTKDGAGNIVKMQDPGGTITYTYYGNGVMKAANYGTHKVETEIDNWGRKKKLTDPSAGTYTYKYNSIGEVLEETTPKGKTTYTYDNFGKINTKKIKGDHTDITLNYQYNTTSKLLTSINGSNARTHEDYSYSYTYDSYYRPETTIEENGKARFEYKIAHDAYGRVSSETYTSKVLKSETAAEKQSIVKVKNIYDANSGVLTEIRDFNTNNSLWKIKEVNARGQAKEIHLGNGMVKKRVYDAFGFTKSILDQTPLDTPTVALDLAYDFNAVRGNLNSRKNNNFAWNESFTYDNLDRLTNIAGSVTRNQEYDTRGRIKVNSEVGDYNYKDATSYHLKDVSLNKRGDLHYQNHPLQKITYNAFKKPISIAVENKARVDFDYGILQNRSHAYYGGNQESKLERRYQKHYSAISPVEIEKDSQGNVKFLTYIGGDAYSAPVVYVSQSATGKTSGYHYLHRDYLNSILAITDGSANVVEQRQFGAWGEVDRFKRLESEITFTYDTTLLNRGYTGHEHFVDVALIHMNGRIYDAKLGRFLSPDNYIQEPYSTQSFNRFGYVWNNPLKFTDPSGEIFWLAVAIGAVIGGYIGGAVANKDLNPFNWEYQNADTWLGIGIGALLGAVGGQMIAAGKMSLIVSAGTNIGGASFTVASAAWTNGTFAVSALGGMLGLYADNWQQDDTSISQNMKDAFSEGIDDTNSGSYVTTGDLMMTSVEYDAVFEIQTSPDYVKQAVYRSRRNFYNHEVTRAIAEVTIFVVTGGVGEVFALSRSAYRVAPKLIKSGAKAVKSLFPNAARGSNYVNLASKSRTAHIIAGDATGGGHAWFGSAKSFMNGLTGKKSMFPATWSNSKIMNGVSEVVTSNPWIQQTGRAGAMFTRSGQPVRFVTEGYYNGLKIRVINTHSEIITAFPIR